MSKFSNEQNHDNGFTSATGPNQQGDQQNYYGWKTEDGPYQGGENTHCHAWTNGKSHDGEPSTIQGGVQHRGGCEACREESSSGK